MSDASSSDAASLSKSLSLSDARAATERLADLTAAGAPLSAGLRAAAEQTSSRRLRANLQRVADEIERGAPLENALADASGLPAFLRGLVLAAQAAGSPAETLAELIEHHRRHRELWKSFTASIAYPGILLVIALTMFVVLDVFIIRALFDLYREMEVNLGFGVMTSSRLSEALLYTSRGLLWFIGGTAAVASVVSAVVRTLFGAAAHRRLLGMAPLIGPLWRWSGAAEGLRLLGMLVECRIPLAKALPLAAGAVSAADVAQTFERLTDGANQGQPLAALLARSRSLPESTLPLIHWGEGAGSLGEGLHAAAEMLEGRFRQRTWLLRSVLPPVLFVFVGILAIFLYALVLMPMITLIDGLV